jgi:hypothetical protein
MIFCPGTFRKYYTLLYYVAPLGSAGLQNGPEKDLCFGGRGLLHLKKVANKDMISGLIGFRKYVQSAPDVSFLFLVGFKI